MRVNVDSDFLAADPRWKRLLRLTGESVPTLLGRIVLAWMACYARRSAVISCEEIDIASERAGFAQDLVSSDLAKIYADGQVWVCGVTKRIPYLLEAQARAKVAGLASGRARRSEIGKYASSKSGESKHAIDSNQLDVSSREHANDSAAQDQHANDFAADNVWSQHESNRNDEHANDFAADEHHPNPPPPAPSLKKHTPAERPARVTDQDLEQAYKAYPLKEGKTRGLVKAKAQVKTQEDLVRFQAAIANYARKVRDYEPRFIKHFSTFMGCWQDYLVEEPAPKPARPQRPLPVPPPPADRVTAEEVRAALGGALGKVLRTVGGK